MQAGADAILVPSRFEPCGLTQMCALRYGALPVVSHVGGLADTVVDANDAAVAAGVATGFQFAPVTSDQLAFAIGRALALWKDPPRWRRLQARAMATDVSWRHSAQQYARLYRDLAVRTYCESNRRYTDVPNRQHDRRNGLMNRIVYIVGLVVIVLAVLAFFGLQIGRHTSSVSFRIRSSSPSDHAWNGQPRGVCGGSPSAISRQVAEPGVSRCASSGARKRARASAAARRRVAVHAQPGLDERAR